MSLKKRNLEELYKPEQLILQILPRAYDNLNPEPALFDPVSKITFSKY